MTTREPLSAVSSNLDSPYAKALLSRPKPQRSRQLRKQSCPPPTKPATDEEDEEDAYFSADECPSTPAAAAPENIYDNLEPSAAPVASVNQQLLSELSGVLGARRMSSAKPTESPARRSSTAPGAQAFVLANAAAEIVAQRAKKKEAAAEKARAAEAAEVAEAAEAAEASLEAEAAWAAEVEATQAAEAEAAQVAEAKAEHARALAEVGAESERTRLETEAKMRQLEEAQLAAEAKAETLKAAAAQAHVDAGNGADDNIKHKPFIF